MKRLYGYCEGQTEESFVGEVLYLYLLNMNISATPIVCETKRTISQKFKGGVSDYGKIKKELDGICKQHKNELVTTMFDYYGLPDNTPNLDIKSRNVYEKVQRIETAIETDMGNLRNLIFHLTVHEFEGLLFSDVAAFWEIADKSTTVELQKIRDSFASPEHINNSEDTAPSKRITKLIPSYSKVRDGTRFAKSIGIDKISLQCEHFRKWMTRLVSYGS